MFPSFTRRGLQSSTRLLAEPVSQKQKVADENFKHELVTCHAQWTSCVEKKNQLVTNPAVVIVGAGMSGLSAASRLHKAGITNVIVVEALDRPGGRVHTCGFGGTHVDLGGEDIYGTNISNPAFNIAVLENLLTDVGHSLQNSPFYASGGLVLFDVRKPYEIFKSVLQEAKSIFKRPQKSQKSVKEYITPKIKHAMETNEDFDQKDYVTMVISGLQNESRARWGDDLSNISADSFGSYISIGNGSVKLKKGASRLLDPFLSSISNKIKYNKPVQSIRWNSQCMKESKPASVLCCDGEVFPCDFVICTVSLGVLKSQADTLFSPALPKSKLEAITNLSFGHIDKLFFEYDKPFWIPGEGIFRVAWSPQELENRKDWLKGLGSIEEVSRKILKVSVGGREAAWSEGCSDRSIAEELTLFLRKLLGDPSLPCPKRLIRSRWSSDIYFAGAISYLGLASSIEDQCALMAPVPNISPPVLLFAGEATSPGYFSTVHGAILSGYREADRIIQSCQVDQMNQQD